MVLVHSPALAARDGLDRKTRAVATGTACTLLLIVTNGAAYLLSAVVLPIMPLSPSTGATVVPLMAMPAGAAVVMATIAVARRMNATLHQLLNDLAPAVGAATVLLAAVTALLAPAENILHAALAAIGIGFGFALLLQLCAAVADGLEAVVAAERSRHPKTTLRATLLHLTENKPVSILLVAGLLAMLGVAFKAAW
jgi:hypothetical protein